MRKSNSKLLYQLTRRLKNQPPPTLADDSLEVILSKKAKMSHCRSQSCPFTPEIISHTRHPTFPLPPQPTLRQQQPNVPIPTHYKKPSQQFSSSQGSMSSQTVIIREVDVGEKVGKRRLKGECFAKTKVSQQMRSYQLRHQLASVQKEVDSTNIKQRIMVGLLQRCDQEILEHSFEFA